MKQSRSRKVAYNSSNIYFSYPPASKQRKLTKQILNRFLFGNDSNGSGGTDFNMKNRIGLVKVVTSLLIPLLFVSFIAAMLVKPVYAVTWDHTVFQEKLSSGWKNWSWGASVDFSESSVRYSGSDSIKFDMKPWGALYLHTDKNVSLSEYSGLQFQLKSSANDQKLQIIFYDENNKEFAKKKLTDFGEPTSKSWWKEYFVPFSKLSGSSKIKGFAIQDAEGKDQPAVYIDNVYIKSESYSGPGSSGDSDSGSTDPEQPKEEPKQPQPEQPVSGNGFTTSNNAIYKDGKAVKLKGVNWFGFDGGTNVVHGLWTRNWKDMISQMKSLGFNAVRIPVCPASVDGTTPTSIDYGKNSDLKGLNSLQILDKIMNEFNNQGMYTLIDIHTPDCKAISDLWYTSSYSESAWIDDLKSLAGRYKGLSNFVGLDLKNEPKGSATWGTGDVKTDWKMAAERAGKAVLSTNPNILIFVEGVQNNPTCTSSIAHFWGGNLEPVACKPVNNDYIPANKLVFSPHVYGPDVHMQSYFSASNFPYNMPEIWNKHFGYLVEKGYTIVPGEWGGKYGNGGVSKDVTWQNALVNYYKDKKICSSFYWDWNPNSTDTGGILQNDWSTPWKNKVDMLNGYYSGCSL